MPYSHNFVQNCINTGTNSAHMFQRGLAINVNTDTSSQSINAKPMGTISVHMFQRELAINANTETSSQWINAKPMGTISVHMFQRGHVNTDTSS